MNDLQPPIAPPRRRLDPEPSDRVGAVYSAANLATGRFSFETELGSGERMRVALGPSSGVVGEVSSHDGTTTVDARTETHLTADTFHWPLDTGEVSVRGPVALEGLAVELLFASGESPAGRITAPRCRAGHLEIDLPMLDEPLVVSHVELNELRVTLEDGLTRLVAGSLSAGRLSIRLPQGTLRIDQLLLTGIELISRQGESPELHLGAVEIDGMKLDLEGGYLALHGVLATGVERVRELQMRQVRVQDGHVVTTARKPAEPAPPGRRASPVDLTFLNALEGHIHADVSTHVRLPLIPDWRALHRVRLDVRDGRIEFDRLEHGLSKLPDAVLDFKLREGRLCLDKDIPAVPFDRTTLLSWPLSDDELQHAQEGWVQLSKLLEPKVEIQRRKRKRDDGGRFLQEVRIQDIDVSLSLGSDEMVDLPAGGRLRLGAAAAEGRSERAPAIESTSIHGQIVYRPDHRRPDGAVTIEAKQLALGLEDVPVGERCLDAPDLRVAQVRCEIQTRDLSVERVYTDLEGVELQNFVIAA